MFAKKKQEGIHGTPDFIDILSYDDRKSYEKLQSDVGSPEYRYNRNHRFSTLSEILKKIKSYCQTNENDKWKRYLVCGVCWFDVYMAINTKQLRFLICKSKSTINDALSKMGYTPVSMKGEPSLLLVETIPFLFGNQSEYRKWSIRKNNISDINVVNEIAYENDNLICDDDEEQCKEESIYLDELVKNLDSVKNEKDDEFKFINFTENVNDDFDIGFGYDYCNFSSNIDSSNDEQNEIIDFEYLNRAYEEGTTGLY